MLSNTIRKRSDNLIQIKSEKVSRTMRDAEGAAELVKENGGDYAVISLDQEVYYQFA